MLVMNPSYSCLLQYLLDTISLALTKKMVVAVFNLFSFYYLYVLLQLVYSDSVKGPLPNN